MATVWSASSGYMFIGIALSWSGNPSSGSVTVTAEVTACSDGYGHDWTSQWSWWGYSGSGSAPFSFHSGFGQTVYKQISKWSFNVPLKYGSTTKVGIGASLGPIWNGGRPAVENYITLPARPISAPNAPTGARATRVSDSQITVSWIAPLSTDARPVGSYVVERRADESPSWGVVAQVRGATSLASLNVSAGHRYVYRVKAVNSAGGSAYAQADQVYTTPPAPINVRAEKNVDGDIVVTWGNKAPYTPTRWDIYDGPTRVGQVTLNTQDTRWVHRSPRLDVTHQYQVVCVGGTLESPKSDLSNVVQLLARPNAPEPVSDGIYFPSDAPVTLAWRHNPTDSSPQTRYVIQYLNKGTGALSPEIDRRDTAQEASVGLLPAGVYEYWVQTWGLHADGSPVSRRATFYVEDRPLVSILAPDETVKTSFTEVAWSYSQTQGAPAQSRARVDLYQDSGLGLLVESQEVRAPVTRVRLAAHLENGQTYRVVVVAANAHGVESLEAVQTFTVAYEQPPAPHVHPEWDEGDGCVRVRVVNPAPEAGKPAAVRNRVERSDDGGVTWATITEDLPVSGTFCDYQSNSHGETRYRVTATSELPSSAATTEGLVIESWAMWIGGGGDFGATVPLRWDPLHSCKTGLANRKLYRFAGRTKAVEVSGRHRAKTLSISSTLFDEDWPLIQRLEELSYMPGPFLYRDPMGRRVYCSIQDVTADRALSGKWGVKLEIEEVDHD